MWTNKIIYQLYLPSFQKNFKQIAEMGEYFKKLNISTIWFSPIFPSGGKDNGYDVTDFYTTDNKYGSLDDFKYMINKLHSNKIKILIDMIPNHTSIKHKWFQDARHLDSKKRNWYVWAKENELPTNWFSYFEDKPWTLDKKSNMYYYHHFYKEQPDLNFWNIEVREEIIKIFRYWLDLGVDGFRVDAIGCLYHDKNLLDNKNNLRQNQMNKPETIEFIKELKDTLKKGDD